MANTDLIKNRLKDAIKQSGISQSALSRQLSLSPSCIAHYVKGDILPSLETFTDICKILDVDPAYLLGIED